MAVAVGLLALLTTAQSEAQRPMPEGVDQQIQELKKTLPKSPELLAALSAAPEPSGTLPLPEPSLTEPFEIGEALYDPGRLEDAVLSMLALMRIGIVPDAGAAAKANQQGLALSESEVRALIDMGMEDLASAEDIENLPYSFADLHRAVAPLLPGVSVEQMAESYTRAYEMAPEDLVAKALMGQPIEPGTKLTRTQIWFLLMDGFAGGSAGDARWGTADRELPDAPSPNAQWSATEWREVLARLPLVSASQLVTVSAPDIITQGATARPAPVGITLRINPSAPPLVSRSTGRTLIAARAGSLAEQEVTWSVRDNSAIEEIGTITSPTNQPVRVGADGIARFVFQPGVAATGGAGETVDDWETVEARFQTRGLVAGAYAIPAALANLPFGSSRARANLHLRWRSPDVLFLWVANIYGGINFQIPNVGGGTRDGFDVVLAKLWKHSSGSYQGLGFGFVHVRQTLRGPTTCQTAEARMRQQLYVLATHEVTFPGLGPTKALDQFRWQDSQFRGMGVTMESSPPDGGYYRLEFFPGTQPKFLSGTGAQQQLPPRLRTCLPLIPAGRDRQGFGANWFIPFNDAQWTTSGQGYGIGLRSRGPTYYVDLSGYDPLAEAPAPGQPDLRKVKALLQLTGHSVWLVRVARTMKEVDPLAEP
jgi:hypothetical protein